MEKQTPHYAHPTGFALGITSGIVYTLCAVAVALWPVQTVRFFSYWFHGIDLSRIFVMPQLTFGIYFLRLVQVVLFFYITGLIYGWVYNKCVAHCKRMGWI